MLHPKPLDCFPRSLPTPATAAQRPLTWRVVAVQLVAAAGVGPDLGERDLARRTLLQEQLVLRVEQEHAERAVQQAARLGGVEPAEWPGRESRRWAQCWVIEQGVGAEEDGISSLSSCIDMAPLQRTGGTT